MGSIVTVTAYCDDEVLCDHAIDQAFREMKAVDRLMSVFDTQSQVSLVNRHAGKAEVHVDRRIIEVLNQAKAYSDLTGGAFDVTVEPLMELYGFRDENTIHHFPSDRQITEVLDGVGVDKITVDTQRSTVVLEHEKTRLDFGGIAVGYAIDRAVGILKSYGIESALINHSGDIYALGTLPREDAWEVGITDPLRPEEIITTLFIKDQALSTSGNYQNFIEAEGHTVGHLLNPRTGQPASTILSATTIADTAIEADALSTGFFVLGIDKAKAIIEHSKNLQCIAVVQKGGDEEIVKLCSPVFDRLG